MPPKQRGSGCGPSKMCGRSKKNEILPEETRKDASFTFSLDKDTFGHLLNNLHKKDVASLSAASRGLRLSTSEWRHKHPLYYKEIEFPLHVSTNLIAFTFQFDPRNNRRIWIGTNITPLALYELDTMRIMKQTDVTGKVTLSSDGEQFAYKLPNNNIHIVNTETLEKMHTLPNRQEFYTMAFAPNKQHFVYAAMDISVWDLNKSLKLKTLKNHTYAVTKFAFHPNGTYFATGSYDSTVRLWDANTWKQIKVWKDDERYHPMYCVTFHKDGKQFVAGSRNDILIYNADVNADVDHPGRVVDHLIKKIDTKLGNIMEIEFIPNKPLVVVCSYEQKKVQIWNIDTNEMLLNINNALKMSVSPKGHLAVLVVKDIRIKNVAKTHLFVRVYENISKLA
jgi:WD40 repeat protein